MLASVMSSAVAINAATAEPEDYLEEIIVTASKRSQQLQDVPAAISALSADRLEAMGADDFTDYARSIPGLTFTDLGAGRQKPSMRGVSVTIGAPVVTYYIGETPIPASTGTLRLSSVNPKLVDIQRIEVLRGPQGTLYGSSSLAGTIKFIPNSPDFENFGGRIGADLSMTESGGEGLEIDGVVNIPLVEDKLAIRGAAWYRDIDGFVDRRIVGTLSGEVAPTLIDVEKDLPKETTKGVRLIAALKPSEAISLEAMVFHQKQEFSGFQDITLGATNADEGLYQDLLLDVEEPSRNSFTLYNLTGTVDVDGWALTSATSYYEGNLTASEEGVAFVDAFFGGDPFYNRLEEVTGAKVFTQEARIATTESIMGFNLIAGVFYNKNDGHRTVFWRPEGWNERFVPTDASLFTPGNDLFTSQTEPDQRETSFFGELSYDITDALSLTGGLRHYEIKSTGSGKVTGLFNNFTDPAEPRFLSTQAKSSGEVYKINLAYQADEDKLTYLQYSEGFRPGFGLGALPSTCAADLAALGIDGDGGQVLPDKTKNYEAGAKTSWLDNRLILNFAVYRTDWTDIQQSLFLPCGLTLVANAGQARNQGFEMDVEAVVAAGLSAGGSLAYINAKLKKDAPAFGASVGDRIPDVPRWQGSAFMQYEFAAPASWYGSLRLDYQYSGSAYMDFNRVGADRDPLSLRDDLHLVNLRLSFERGGWSVDLYGKNLTNDVQRISRAESLVLNVPDRPRFVVNRPRTFGVSTAYRF